MSDFPSLSRSPDIEEFVEEYDTESVKAADYASGYPLVDVQFTLLLPGFKRKFRHVSEYDKDLVKDHYEDNRGNTFYWIDVRSNKQYEVIYDPNKPPPSFKLDGRNDEFMFEFYFKQASSVVTDL